MKPGIAVLLMAGGLTAAWLLTAPAARAADPFTLTSPAWPASVEPIDAAVRQEVATKFAEALTNDYAYADKGPRWPLRSGQSWRRGPRIKSRRPRNLRRRCKPMSG